MLKVLSKIGITTVNKLESAIDALRKSYIDSLKAEKKSYKKALKILEEQYNDELAKLTLDNEVLKKENEDLLEDIAIALLGENAEDIVPIVRDLNKNTNIASPPTVKHSYAPKETTVRDQSMIYKLEEKLKSIPDGARGTGGIEVILNGKLVTKSFNSKSELQEILNQAKAGDILIAQQAGL